MGEKRATEGQSEAELPAFNQRQWQEVIGLLDAGRYRDAANLLKKSEASANANGNHALATVLNATRHICLAGNDFRAEVKHHQQAYTVATEREAQLREHLQALLNIVAGRVPGTEQAITTSFSPLSLPEQERQIPRILRRIQTLLGRGSDFMLSSAARETPSDAEPADQPHDGSPGQKAPTPQAGDNVDLHMAAHESEPRPSLAVYCFGHFRAYLNDAPIDVWTGNISKSIFKYMVIHREGPIPIEVLLEVFWPDTDPESARRSLYQAIYQIRQAFQSVKPEVSIIRSSNGAYGMNPDISTWLDCEEFIRQYDYGRQMYRRGNIREATAAYETADSLHDGEFLVDELYEDWTFQQREHLLRVHREILAKLSRSYYEQGRWGICISYAQRLLDRDGCNEAAHRVLMQAYYRQGQRHLALRQYYRCVETLKRELETEPMAETVKLHRKLRKDQLHFSPSTELN